MTTVTTPVGEPPSVPRLPAATPVADPVRRASMRRRIDHDQRELQHGLGPDHLEGRTWRDRHHDVTLATAARIADTTERNSTRE